MIIHQLYVDHFSQCISQVTKAYSHGMHGVAESTRLTLYFCTYETFDLVELIYLNWQHLLGPMFCKTLNVFNDQTTYFSKRHFRSFNVTVTVML